MPMAPEPSIPTSAASAPSTPIELIVECGPVPIAVRDFGGTGLPLILVHGAGGNLLAWTTTAQRLTLHHRVVALDLRGHGRSGDGPWSWADALTDIAAVADHFGFDNPAVAGHSLGGSIATWWGREHPDCPGIVNFDGHRGAETHPDNYVGMDPAQLAADLARLSELFTGQAHAMGQPLAPEQVEAMRNQHRAQAADLVLTEEQAVEIFDRNLTVRDGQTFLRPGPEFVSALRASLLEDDLFPVLHEVRCPILVCLATRELPAAQAFGDLMAAFRRGLDRDFAKLRAANPAVHVVEVNASHAMTLEQPEDLTDRLVEFLAGRG